MWKVPERNYDINLTCVITYLNEFEQSRERSQKRNQVGITRSFYLRDDPCGLSTTVMGHHRWSVSLDLSLNGTRMYHIREAHWILFIRSNVQRTSYRLLCSS